MTAHVCGMGRGLQMRSKPRVQFRNSRRSLSVKTASISPPPIAEDELLAAGFCGQEGQVLQREAPAGLPKNGKAYHIHTFGCQMNLADSERMAGVLEAEGYTCTADPDKADVLVYNTCSIRDKSEQKVYSALGPQAKRKRKHMADLKVVVAGCVAQQEGETLLRRVPEVDVVMGPQFANQIHTLLHRVDELGTQVCATDQIEIPEDITVPRRGSDISAWVNVIYGCNEKCAYCVVPYTRGLEQSRKPEDIKREMLAVAEAGYKEVTLLGQNIDAYGRDLPGMAPDGSGRRLWTFTDLLHYLHDVPGIDRIRFATSHPRYFTERLIRACAELPKVCEFLHVPVQSGDDDILRAMKRGYTSSRYMRIIDTIRHYMPNASISTDFIVGFPGETEEQYMRTEEMVRQVGFDRVNTAAYSPRPNTPAAEWENQVAELVKMDRLNRLNRVVMDVASERSKRFTGHTWEVLVEGVNPKDPSQAFGRNDHNKLVFFPGDGNALRAKYVQVHVHKSLAYSLFGNMVGEPSDRALAVVGAEAGRQPVAGVVPTPLGVLDATQGVELAGCA